MAAPTMDGVQALRARLCAGRTEVLFSETLAVIAADFKYTPKPFVNAGVESAAGTNEGSCKVFALGKIAGFTEDEVLACFGEHYRQVLSDPSGTSHGNIRSFMKHGWAGIGFPDGLALSLAAKSMPSLQELRGCLLNSPKSLVFSETLAAIAAEFDYAPKRFVNGGVESAAGANEGSCKVFALGKLAGLTKEETLACFGEHYRQVLGDPKGTSHGNIRAFMKHGWGGIEFPDGLPLALARGALPTVTVLQARLCAKEEALMFSETLATISAHFIYTPKRFVNGGAESPAGSNEGSCKVFSLGKLAGFSKEEVLASFGEHYRQVLQDKDGTSHGNIRAFMKHGWDGIELPDGLALAPAPDSQPGLRELRSRLLHSPKELAFSETLAAIAADFEYAPKRFVNGGVESAAGTNEGSCKVFSLGKLAGLTEEEVLASFGEHHRQVLGDPEGSSHGNIRAFMKSGWPGISFPDGLALTCKSRSAKRRKIS